MDGLCCDCKYRKENNGQSLCEHIFEGISIICEDVQSNHAIEVDGDFGCVYFESKDIGKP